MNFWNFLGLSCLLGSIFKSRKHTCTQNYEPTRESDIEDRYDYLSERIDELENRINDLDQDSDVYDEIYEDIELLRDELNEIENERDDLDFL